MKKILLSAAFLVAALTGANAQTILLNENFNDYQNWTEDQYWYQINLSTIDEAEPWYIYSAGNFDDLDLPTATIASASFYTDGPGQDANLIPYAVDNIMLSPVIELPAEGVELTLNFDLASFGAATANLGFSVITLTQSQLTDENFDFNDATTVYSSTLTGSTIAANISVNLSDMVTFGEAMMFGFKHNGSTGLGYVIVDNVVLTSSATASTGNFASSTFSVYPNPAKDVINVANSADAIENVTITDMNGRVVKQVVLGINEGQINIADLSQGVYILNATSNGKSVTEKIVKQ